MNPYLLDEAETGRLAALDVFISYSCEADEFWGFVGNKGNQGRAWYVSGRRTGMIVAWHNGDGSDKSYGELLKKMSGIPIKRLYTDEWGAYQRLTPANITHVTGKGQYMENRKKKP